MGIIGIIFAFWFIYWLVQDDKRRRLQRELDRQRRQEQREQQAQVQAATTPPPEPRAPAKPPVVSTGSNAPSMNEPEPRSTDEPPQPQPKGLEYLPELAGRSIASAGCGIVGVLGAVVAVGFLAAAFDSLVSAAPYIIGIAIIAWIVWAIITKKKKHKT